jgi:UDP-N-acetyl-2-amino-2-deoxyglucuronate dehydrogenase
MTEKEADRRLFLKRGSMLVGASLLGGPQSMPSQTSEIGKVMPPSLKVALLTGQGAPHLGIYLDCIAKTTGVQEVAVADPSGDIFGEAKRVLEGRFGALPLYRDRDRLFQERKPDLAIVSLAANDAPAAIKIALSHDCHVLAEKPACVRLEDFEYLADLSEQKHRQLMLAFATRMNPVVVKARDLVESGAIGRLYGASMYFLADQARLHRPAYQSSWVASKTTAGGGHLIWLGIHYLDLIQFITSRRILKIGGFIENVGGASTDVEDSAAVSMQLDGGLLATLQSGYYLDRNYESLIRVWGSEGWLKADLVSGFPLEWHSNRDGKTETFATSPDDQSSAYPHFIQAVIDASLQGTVPPVTTRESLQTLKAVFRFYEAASHGVIQQLT